MTKGPVLIHGSNLSHAWATALGAVMAAPGGEIVSLMVTITRDSEETPLEDVAIRAKLDDQLNTMSEFSIETVASTIFPISMWSKGQDRSRLFERYRRTWPRIKATSNNKYGTYFHRMIDYGKPGNDEKREVAARRNQLEHVIRTYKGDNHRRSALQLAIFDPTSDHTNQRQRGFPCLQQVAFTPYNDGQLAVTGFYPAQHLFEKAYGNYLGLWRLGEFVGHEIGLKMARLTCVASVGRLGDKRKSDLRAFVQECQDHVKAPTTIEDATAANVGSFK